MDIQAEQWRPVEGFEGYYDISSYGRLRSYSRARHFGRELKPENATINAFYVSGSGYPSYCLYKDGTKHRASAHRLVAVAFLPNPDLLPEVNHLDGNKENNYYENLEWTTKVGNMRHAYQTGLARSGERHYLARHTKEMALMVAGALIAGGRSHSELCAIFKVSKGFVEDISRNKSGYIKYK